jgi:phospholipid transport system substrate-binding protein
VLLACSYAALAAAAAPAATAAAAAPAAAGEANVDTSNPGRLIETAANSMLQDLDAHRADYLKNPAKIEALVTRLLLPHFDTDYSAQMVLGRHWTNATPEQRRRFVEGFYHSILRNYSSALAGFKGDRLKVVPFSGDPAAATATVRSQVRSSSGENVSVNYTLHRVNGEWKAWDVVIDGISYVKSFRDDYGTAVDRDGLDALISRLELQAAGKPAAPRKS